MESVLTILFAALILLLLHSYVFYPIIMFLISFVFKKDFAISVNNLPSVSVIISAYNEEKVIKATVLNILESDYDLGKIEVLVGSDCSNDSTVSVVNALAADYKQVKVYDFKKRRGKPPVLNDLVNQASGEILIFADANTIYSKYAIKEMCKYYVDENVGGVCGKLVLRDSADSVQEGSQERIYWEFESRLKKIEGRIGLLIGANGGIYSIRKELYSQLPTENPITDDLFISLNVIGKGKALLYEKDAVAEEVVAPSLEVEFNRKVRNISLNLFTLNKISHLIKPSTGLLSFAIWSHKIIRWFTPLILFFILLVNLLIINSNDIFRYLLIFQLAIYLISLIGFIFNRLKFTKFPFTLFYYFLMTNLAMLVGIYRYITRTQTTFWQSTSRN